MKKTFYSTLLLLASPLSMAMEQQQDPSHLNQDHPRLNIVSLPPYNKNSSIQTWGKSQQYLKINSIRKG